MAGVGAARLVELGLSRHNLHASGARVRAEDGFGAIVAVHVALFALPLAEIVALRRRPQRAAPVLAALLTGATALRWWAIASLGRGWSVRVALAPNFEPSQRGPYRWIRHPNYVALALEFFALPALGGAWISAALLSGVHGLVVWGRIRAEERLLETVPDYRERFRKRARFLPGVF